MDFYLSVAGFPSIYSSVGGVGFSFLLSIIVGPWLREGEESTALLCTRCTYFSSS